MDTQNQNHDYASFRTQEVSHAGLTPTDFDKFLLTDQLEIVYSMTQSSGSKGGKTTRKNLQQTYSEARDMEWLGMSPDEQMVACSLTVVSGFLRLCRRLCALHHCLATRPVQPGRQLGLEDKRSVRHVDHRRWTSRSLRPRRAWGGMTSPRCAFLSPPCSPTCLEISTLYSMLLSHTSDTCKNV